MKTRTKENVRQSGYVSYKIEVKKWYGWITLKTFISRKERDNYLTNVVDSNQAVP